MFIKENNKIFKNYMGVIEFKKTAELKEILSDIEGWDDAENDTRNRKDLKTAIIKFYIDTRKGNSLNAEKLRNKKDFIKWLQW